LLDRTAHDARRLPPTNEGQRSKGFDYHDRLSEGLPPKQHAAVWLQRGSAAASIKDGAGDTLGREYACAWDGAALRPRARQRAAIARIVPRRRGGQPGRVREVPSAGVGLKRSYTVPLQAMRSVPVHTIALPPRELSGDGPGVIVCQLSVSRL